MTTPDLATIVDEQEAEIGRLVAELAVVRRDWQADVGTLTARAQTAEARAEQYENGRWHSYETVQAIVKEREELRAEAARLRERIESELVALENARMKRGKFANDEMPEHMITKDGFGPMSYAEMAIIRVCVTRVRAALRGPAQSEQP